MTTETQEQITLIARAKYHPILRDFLWAVPNDEKRHPIRGAYQVKKGLKAGVADLSLPYPVPPYHGMFIELKRLVPSKGKLSPEQVHFLDRQAKVGYATCVAYGADQAWAVMMQYLDGKFEQKAIIK
jgi:hypothetical protein